MPERGQAARSLSPATVVSQAAEMGVALDPAQAERLIAFAELLLRWNRAFNLVSRQDTERLLPRHLLDSLSVANRLEGPRVLDLGTGAGLPGLPLAVARADLEFVLVDRNARKIRFVTQALRALELANVEALCADAAAIEPAGSFATVISRAVAEPDELWTLAEPLLAPGGRLLILRHGQRAETAGQTARGVSGARLERFDVRIPGLSRPHGVLVLERSA